MSNHDELSSLGYPDHVYSFYSGTLTGVAAGGFAKIESVLAESDATSAAAISSLMESVSLLGQVSGFLAF